MKFCQSAYNYSQPRRNKFVTIKVWVSIDDKGTLAFEGVLGTHTHSMSTKFSLNDISTFNRKIKNLLIFLLKICFDFFTISYL